MNRLKFLEDIGGRYALYICECGNKKRIRKDHVNANLTRSCGCLNVEVATITNTTHGMKDSRIYNIYLGMIDRCYNNKNPVYKRYGLRGIKVCDEWNSLVVGTSNGFINFYKWASSNGYKNNLTIDRIDNNNNYCPENCRWATVYEQSRNTCRNRYITINNNTKVLSDWLKDDICKCSKFTFYNRINAGWNEVEAITTPTRRTK